MANQNVGMIWAQDRHRVLGADGDMLWRVPADFKHFKAATMGCSLIMGRTTFTSLGGALPGRRNIVLSRRPQFSAPGASVVSSLDDAVALATTDLPQDVREGELARSWPRVWIIGGAQVYSQAIQLGLASTLVVSSLDLDAATGTTSHPETTSAAALVYAPEISLEQWQWDAARSDAADSWRPRSGDATWRLDTWTRK